MDSRFVLIENNSEYPNDGETCWYWDRTRPIPHLKDDKDTPDYVAVQCYCSRNPNNFIPRGDDLHLLFTDQAEYYAVCGSCFSKFRHLQWSGSTFDPGWREKSEKYLKYSIEKKGWCEFCDPIFGSGGWA